MITQGFTYKGIVGAADENEIVQGADWTQYSYLMEFDLQGTEITYNKNLIITNSFFFYKRPTTPVYELFDQSDYFAVDSACIQHPGAVEGYPQLQENYNGEYWGVLRLAKGGDTPAVVFKQFPSNHYTQLPSSYLLDIPKTFFYYTIVATPDLPLHKKNSLLYKTYSFILEPVKLALLPVYVERKDNCWTIVTSACLKKPRYYPFDTLTQTQSAYNLIEYEKERDLRKNGIESFDYIDTRPYKVPKSFLSVDRQYESKIPSDVYVRIPSLIYFDKYYVEYDLAFNNNYVKRQIISPTLFNLNQNLRFDSNIDLIDYELVGEYAAYKWLEDEENLNYYIKPKVDIGSTKFSYQFTYNFINWQTTLPETSILGENYNTSVAGKTVFEDGLGAHNNGFYQTPIIHNYVDYDTTGQVYQFLQFKPSTASSGSLGDFEFAVASAWVDYNLNEVTLTRIASTSEFLGLCCLPSSNGIEMSYEYETYFYKPSTANVGEDWVVYQTDTTNWELEESDPDYGKVDNNIYFSCNWADESVTGLNINFPSTCSSGFNVSSGAFYIRNEDYSAVRFDSDGTNTDNQGPAVLLWNTPKPPHSYSYKIRTINNEERLIDTDSLKFQLKSTVIKKTAREMWVENYIAAPYHHVSYPLTDEWVCEDDYIAYELILDRGYILDEFAQNVKLFVGPRPNDNDDVLKFETEYDLTTETWIPAASANCFKVTYTNLIAGKFKFAIKTKLKHAGGMQESISPVIVEFASESKDWVNPATPIFLENSQEQPNFIEVSASHLTSIISWPNRDLQSSKIYWSAYDAEKNPYIYGHGPKIWSAESKKEIIPGQLYDFNTETSTVQMSGFNPGDYISLYSERYSEESFVKTNEQLTIPSRDLQQYFSIKEESSDLNAYTRIIDVSVAYVDVDMEWRALKEDSLYWEWTWDGKISTNNIPVTAYDAEGNLYTAGVTCKVPLLSSIQLHVEPPVASLDYPLLHNLQIKAVLSSSHGRTEAVKNYELEDFPPDDYFKTRMMVSYNANAIFGENLNDINNSIIADTNDSVTGDLYITRKNQGNNLLNQFLVHVDLNALKSYAVDKYQVRTIKNGVPDPWIACEVHNNYNVELFDLVNFNAGMALDITSIDFVQRIEISPPGWKQSYYEDFYIYFKIADPIYFNRVDFISYPYFSWFPWTDQIYVLNNTEWDENYYANWSYAPTALYSHDDTVGFYFCMSANNALYETYTYSFEDKQGNSLFTTQAPAHCSFSNNLIHLPSLPEIREEMFSPEGLKVKLRVSNEAFPADMPLQYKALNFDGELETLYYKLTAESWDANLVDIYYPDIVTGTGPTGPWNDNSEPASSIENHPYKKSLRLHEYEDALHYNFVFFTHDPLVNMSYQNNIRIWQSIGMLEQTPLSILDIKNIKEDVYYTVTYLISCANWTDTVTIPYSQLENPDVSIYSLQIGDGSKVGFIDINDVYTPFVVKALSYDIEIGMADHVLDYLHEHWQNYRGIYNPLPPYLQHRVFTEADPEAVGYNVLVKNSWFDSTIYLSTYHALTGKQIDFEIKVPPRETEYTIAINYGDGVIEYASLPDEITGFTLKKTHSYDTDGTYYISYSAIDDSDPQLFKTIKTLEETVTIYREYDTKSFNSLRVYGEERLQLPYSLNECLIKPNEFTDYSVLNQSIKNLLNNLEYLENKTIVTPNTTPTNHFGWLGYSEVSKKTGLRWWSLSDNNEYYYQPYLAENGENDFNDLRDVIEQDNHIIALNSNKILFYKKGQYPEPVELLNSEEISANLINPVGMVLKNNNLYVLDSLLNKLVCYKITYNASSVYLEQLNVTGGYGAREELTKFDTPTEIYELNNEIYVLDYLNKCIKKYSSELIWQKSFYVDTFETDNPNNFCVNKNGDLYVLSKTGNIYIFDTNANLLKIYSGSATNVTFKKIFFDLPCNYLYIVTSQEILKFDTLTYTYISTFSLNDYRYPNNNNLNFVNARSSFNCSILLILNNCVIKSHDFMIINNMTQGLSSKYWPYEDIKVKPEELVNNLAYNRIFLALAQNIKNFRDRLNSKLNLVKEKTDAGTLIYYTLTNISESDKCILLESVESESLSIKNTEYNIPQVVNRSIIDLYRSLEILLEYLQISDLNIDTHKCDGLFCWSWKQLSCFGSFSLPVIQQCGFNPITYEELKTKNTLEEYTYAPSNTWETAISECCESDKYLSPLNYVI